MRVPHILNLGPKRSVTRRGAGVNNRDVYSIKDWVGSTANIEVWEKKPCRLYQLAIEGSNKLRVK
jgi:hypothetical protein